MTVGEYARGWARLHPRPDPSTSWHNEVMVRPFAVAHERRAVGSVSRACAAGWVQRHPSQARYLRAMFNDARADGLVDANPFDGLVPPARSGEVRPPSEDQVLRVAGSALEALGGWGPMFRSMVLFSAFSGVRMAEMAGVRVEDVVCRDPYRVRVLGKGRRRRTVGVFGPGVEALGDLPARGLVFRSREGRALNRWSVGRGWAVACGAAGVSGFTWHSLRHFCATWLLDGGASVQDVAVQLHGRFDPREVIRTYGHPDHALALERLQVLRNNQGGRR